ncbi:hypothetical protein BO83DRAFT_381456 [Aspergillus eucalypticola CBS 122712]|uniref:Uncharacterized protein n=1 Tax=Aspergillus eucalypticola (strain CBS 122712 / IBT 29274) TaxID=1448314 RepID=A0A317UYF3_ASPEC|nr:uncharacterized protein BO83DRAFT_381456 [Aspergillus eucalypticola CBS 122712]PWY65522.1 hypothetical protein BO83DRAFT_381456 [Aspergillus eucalypticola CBS 122712]
MEYATRREWNHDMTEFYAFWVAFGPIFIMYLTKTLLQTHQGMTINTRNKYNNLMHH